MMNDYVLHLLPYLFVIHHKSQTVSFQLIPTNMTITKNIKKQTCNVVSQNRAGCCFYIHIQFTVDQAQLSVNLMYYKVK